MRILSLFPLVAPLLSTAIGAQSTVTVPDGFKLTEGNSAAYAIFERAPARSQHLIHQNVLPWKNQTRTLNGLRIRADGASTKPAEKHTFEIEISLSSSGVKNIPYPSVSSYKANWGTDHRVVMRRRFVDFPGQTTFSKPDAFSISFVFDAPFIAKGTGMCIDMKSFALTNMTKSWRADAELETWTGSPFGSFAIMGKGCPTDFKCFSSLVYPGSGELKMYAYSRLPKVAPALNWVGTNTKIWGPFPLPAAILQTGCSIYTDMMINVARVTDGTALGRVDAIPLPIPAIPALGGITLHFQFAVLDTAYNAVGLRVSELGSVTFGMGYDPKNVRFLSLYDYGSGSVPFDPDRDTPYFATVSCPIFEVF